MIDLPPPPDDFDAVTELNSLIRAVAHVQEVFRPTQPPPQHMLEVAWEILTAELDRLRAEQRARPRA